MPEPANTRGSRNPIWFVEAGRSMIARSARQDCPPRLPAKIARSARQVQLGFHLKDRFDFNGDRSRQGVGADCASSTDPGVLAEYIPEQLAATVDDGRLLIERVGAANQAQ